MVASVAFVAAPSDTPTVTLSLTAATPDNLSVRVSEFSLGAPQFEGSIESVGAEFGERQVSFVIQVDATYATASTAMQAIARQLLAKRNWLMIQWAPARKPMFLRTYRSQPSAIAWENSGVGIWELPVTLQCDPFLYGAPVTIGPVTISNDPAVGATNRMNYQLPTILGDAATGLKVEILPSQSWNDYCPLMATAAFDPAEPNLASPAPFYWQTQTFALGTDATLTTGDALFSGGNYVNVSFASASVMTTRLSGPAPTTLTPGTYKVLARMQVSTYASVFAVRFGTQTNLVSYTYGDTIPISSPVGASSPFASWYDLGDFTLPVGGSVDLADVGGALTPDVALQAQRVSGTGTLRLDAFLLIPVDTATTVDTFVSRSTFTGAGARPTIRGVWDGTRIPAQFRAYLNSSGVMQTLTPPRIDGRFVRVVPGVANVFYLAQQTASNGPSTTASLNTDAVAATADVTFSYYPKYLYLRPDTT